MRADDDFDDDHHHHGSNWCAEFQRRVILIDFGNLRAGFG
jgi:hypothetical protein